MNFLHISWGLLVASCYLWVAAILSRRGRRASRKKKNQLSPWFVFSVIHPLIFARLSIACLSSAFITFSIAFQSTKGILSELLVPILLILGLQMLIWNISYSIRE